MLLVQSMASLVSSGEKRLSCKEDDFSTVPSQLTYLSTSKTATDIRMLCVKHLMQWSYYHYMTSKPARVRACACTHTCTHTERNAVLLCRYVTHISQALYMLVHTSKYRPHSHVHLGSIISSSWANLVLLSWSVEVLLILSSIMSLVKELWVWVTGF